LRWRDSGQIAPSAGPRGGASCGNGLGTSGAVDGGYRDADGLECDGTTGDLKVKPSATKPSVELLADGMAVKINEADGGLEHNEAGLQVKIKADGGINVDADGILHDAPGVVYWTETAGYFIKGIKTDALGHLGERLCPGRPR
jgi:hypothetical protein